MRSRTPRTPTSGQGAEASSEHASVRSHERYKDLARLFDELVELEAQLQDQQQRQHEVVAECRRLGASWAVIGQALDISYQTAQKRYGRKDPINAHAVRSRARSRGDSTLQEALRARAEGLEAIAAARAMLKGVGLTQDAEWSREELEEERKRLQETINRHNEADAARLGDIVLVRDERRAQLAEYGRVRIDSDPLATDDPSGDESEPGVEGSSAED